MSGNPGVDLDMDWTYNHPWGDLLKVKDEEMSPKKYFIIKNSEGRYYTISPSFEVLWVNDAESAARFDAIRDAVHTANMLDELHGMGFYEPSHSDIDLYLDRVSKLRKRTSVPGWKGPRSVAVLPETWDALLEVIQTIADPVEHGVPFISADECGTLYAKWTLQNGVSFTFEISNNLEYAYEQDTPEFFMYSENLQYRRGMVKDEILQVFQKIMPKSS
jgi:hypothetical protein